MFFWSSHLLKNRYVYSETVGQIEKYYEEKCREIFENKFSDSVNSSARYLHAIPRKWYEITLLKTFPFQKMKITRDIPKEDFITDTNAPIITTGVIVSRNDIRIFLEGNDNYIGIDEKNNYYEVYIVSGEYFLFEGDSSIYYVNKSLEFFMEENNPDLLKKIRATPKTNSKKELVFEIWEYIYPMLSYRYYCHSDTYTSYRYELKNHDNGVVFSVSEENYKNFNIECYTYKELLNFVEHEERFKEEKITLYGQVYRPIKRKNHS